VNDLSQPTAICLNCTDFRIEGEHRAPCDILRAVQLYDFANQLIQIELRQIHRRCARIFAESIHHFLHCFDLLDDRMRSAIEHLRVGFIHRAQQFVPQTFRGQLNWR
jgi:hypothetical protein